MWSSGRSPLWRVGPCGGRCDSGLPLTVVVFCSVMGLPMISCTDLRCMSGVTGCWGRVVGTGLGMSILPSRALVLCLLVSTLGMGFLCCVLETPCGQLVEY